MATDKGSEPGIDAGIDAGIEPNLDVTVESIDGAATITVRGDLEFGTAAMLRVALVEAAQEGHNRLVVDIANLEFIDSTGLSLLVQAKQRMDSEGHAFVLRSPTERVRRVLEISGLEPLFTIE